MSYTEPPPDEHLLPPNATPLEKALSASDKRLLDAPVWIIRAVWDPDLCPEHLLPYLAQAWSLDEWDPAWSAPDKREAIKETIWIHQHKGTFGALKRAIARLGMGVSVSRWFEQTPRGAPYTFRLFVALDEVTDWSSVRAKQLYRVSITNKAVRSLLDIIVLQRTAPSTPVHVGLAARVRIHQRLSIAPTNTIKTPRANAYLAALPFVRMRIRIEPLNL